jgi:hypothetical protein
MKKTNRTVLGVCGVVIAAAAVVGWVSKTMAAPPVCPKIWAPVICDNGKIYPNQCEADKHHAKNCEPYPGGL